MGTEKIRVNEIDGVKLDITNERFSLQKMKITLFLQLTMILLIVQILPN